MASMLLGGQSRQVIYRFAQGDQRDRETSDFEIPRGGNAIQRRRPVRSIATLIVALVLLHPLTGCSDPVRDDLNYDYGVYQLVQTPELEGQDLAQFESVFWEPDDTTSLRGLLNDGQMCSGRSVLEIGTGTGLISLICLQNGASSVVATDINPAAVANARYNAAMLELDENFSVRRVDTEAPGAFAVIKPGERFDLILSNPPWEDGSVGKPAEHALYDPGFELMDSLLEGLPEHLNPGGRCLLAYGHQPAITRLLERAESMGFKSKVLDERELKDLPNDFLPGMLIEIRLGPGQIPKVKAPKVKSNNGGESLKKDE